MEFLIGLFVGAIVTGLLFVFLSKHKKTSGTFVIDFSDPMKDICRLELDGSLESIYKVKRIVLNVKTISQ